MKSIIPTTLLLVFATRAAFGDTLLYDEAVSGDLAPQSAISPDLEEALAVLTLQPGVNRVLGAMSFRDTPGGIPFDVDAFAVTVPVGFELSEIHFDASRTVGNALTFNMAVSPGVAFNNRNIDDPPRPQVLGVISTPIPSSGMSTLSRDFLPLVAGSYAFSFDSGVLDPGVQINPFEWTASLTLTAVPEPGSMLLALLGVAAGCGRRRC